MSKKFEVIILVAISLNTLTMCFRWPNMSKKTEYLVETINQVFGGIFCLEAIIKIIAHGKRYFKDNWNIFDFTIVTANTIILIIGIFVENNFASTASVLRTLRLGRMFKLFRKLKQL